MARPLDDVDLQIVRCLKQDGRLPSADIARAIGVSDKTVRTRIERLIHERGMRVAATIEEDGRPTRLVLALHTEPGCRLRVADRLAATPGVDDVQLTSGAFDLLVHASFPRDSEAFEFLLREVEGTEGIRQIQSSHLIKRVAASLASDAGVITPLRHRTIGTAIQRFVTQAARLGSPEPILELACETLGQSFAVDRVLIRMFRSPQAAAVDAAEQWGSPGYLEASRGFSEHFLAAFHRRLRERPDIVAPARHGLHLYIRDAQQDPLLSGLHDLIKAEGYHSYVTLPCSYGAQVIGWLGLYYDRVYQPDDDELALGQALADQLALAVQRAQDRLANEGVQTDNAAKRLAGLADAGVSADGGPTVKGA